MDNHHKELLQKKNAGLQKQLADKAVELQQKNHALKIEKALDKVQAIAMKMKEPAGMLKVCKTISLQLQALGVKEIRNVQTAIFYEDRDIYMNYEYYAKHKKTFITETNYKDHPIAKKFAHQMLKGPNRVFTHGFKGKEVKDWLKYQKTTNVFIDTYLEKAKSLNYYWYSLGPIALGISTYAPLSNADLDLFKRFRNVFELAYRRYLDIEMAISQTREAQIQLALERVRARTMAMQKSDELPDTTLVLFQQFKSLGVITSQVSICLFDEEIKMGEMFVTLNGEKIDRSFPMELDKEVFVMKKARKAFLNKQKAFSYTVKGKELQRYNHWRNILIGRKGYKESDTVRRQSWHVNAVFFSRGMMGISSDVAPTDEAINLLERFAKVFDLTFTRFLDLQKAEAQVKESQIQLALERVRARTMAMQKSDELSEAVFILFQQFRELGENPDQATIGVINEKEKVIEYWVTMYGKQMDRVFRFSIDEPHVTKKIFNGWKENKKSLVIDLSGKALLEFARYREKMGGAKYNPDEKRRIINVAFFSKGLLNVQSNKARSDESIRLLERFAAVFDQTYIRFLDLQKAEAQAREAKIEAALEKVRSRSLAMHHSDELEQVVVSLFDRLVELGLSFDGALILIFNKEKKSMRLWIATNQLSAPVQIDHPYDEEIRNNSIIKDLWSVIENGKHIFNRSYSGEVKNEYFRYVAKYNGSKIPESVKKFQIERESWTVSLAGERNSILGFDSWSGHLIKNEDFQILVRFAKVFEQAYVRFLDLQKAEAQAREAQIEAALEKVRSRSLAMHKTDELSEVVNVVFEKLAELDIVKGGAASIFIIKEGSNVIEQWAAAPDLLGSASYFTIPFFDQPIHKEFLEAKRSGKDFFIKTISFEEKNRMFNWLFEHSDYKYFPEDTKKWLLACESFTRSDAFAKNSSICIPSYTGQLLSESEIDTLKRFARVFDQAYTRFLDLQRAEAQAREAQIEAALERVRAKTMAMHKSEDLGSVALELFRELLKFGGSVNTCGFVLCDRNKTEDEYWVCWESGVQPPMLIPHTTDPTCINLYKGWEKGEEFYVEEKSGEALKAHFDYMMTIPSVRSVFESWLRNEGNFPARQRWHAAYFKYGFVFVITDKLYPEEQIFKRFAPVFQQAYTRFLDLQKAEAQAREAQIQLALERVRARTMAMHKSEELADTAEVLYHQLKELGDNPERITIGILNETTGVVTWWATDQQGTQLNFRFEATIDEPTVMLKLYKAWKSKNTSLVIDLTGEELSDWVKYCRKEIGVPIKDELLQKRRVQTAGFFSHGWVMITSPHLPAPETINILERFASVFNLTYRRFLDLQKAEAQAREAEVQLALERVRARTMAMQKQNDLLSVLDLLVEQLIKLGVRLEVANFSNGIPDGDWDLWIEVVTDDGTIYNNYVHFPRINHPYFSHVEKNIEAFKRGGTDLFKDVFSKEEKDSWQDYINTQTIYKDITPQQHKQIMYDKPGYTWSSVILKDTWVSICRFNTTPFSDEEDELLRRFANAFSLAYTRFLDLQKAEAQAREANIEAGLERVRSRAMAMQSSEELAALIGTVFTELTRLDLALTRCLIWIFNAETNGATWWMANSEDPQNPISCDVPYNVYEPYLVFLEQWEKGANKFQYELSGTIKKEWDDYLFSKTGLSRLPTVVIEGMRAPERVFLTASFNNFGAMNAATLEPLSDQHVDILLRFAKVFDLTYTRFNDLKQAEAQAKEAKIEASLERVRAKAMAMHSSEDVTSATVTMFAELEKLGIENFRCGINHIKTDRTQEVWSVTNSAGGKTVIAAGSFTIDAHPFWRLMYEAWINKEEFLYYYLAGKEKEDYLKILNATPNYLSQPITGFPDIHFQIYFFGEGSVWTMSLQPNSEEVKQQMKRFASVFSLTFRRYQDLLKAEAQAREAQIEAALEKVRGSAMAMHNSNDLSVTASMVFTELRKMGVNPIRCGVGLLNKESHKAQLYSATSSENGDNLSLVGWVQLEKHPVLEKIYDSWLDQYDYFPELSGEELKSYYQLLTAGLSVGSPDTSGNQKQFGHFFPFSVGCLYAWSDIRYNEGETKILKRFAAIIDLTFRRYIELQKSEANAREAVKQAALDRVRADIASMRTVADLDRITPLIWNELTILGIPFIRCGVFIMDDLNELIHTFLSTPEGKAIAAFHIPYNTSGNIRQVLDHWKDEKNYIDHWDETAFKEFTATLVRQGALSSPEQYLKTLPPGGFYLHFLPFLQGMLYVGNVSRLDDEEIILIQSLANAFSTAYSRYEDFNKLEVAKRQVDSTLNELQTTQKQLIQSEKMASLGELTAGIAHEIQNPLNFVNNFSDVSSELLDEMVEELAKGNLQSATEIAGDVKQNLVKIANHGKRADGIVKGMLQHSRTSSGQKELTDINALCDEYLRLAYHGLRAKDKSFNAKFETDFDNTIGKINIVPQEIGRVVLNLINNAFYAAPLPPEGGFRDANSRHEPTVWVSTKNIGDRVQISVRDNGPGISQKILDKIFQPFFTTKPTGQGTGLGLSLSYDIIKTHGGEIKVKTKEGEGSEFIIQLPALLNQ